MMNVHCAWHKENTEYEVDYDALFELLELLLGGSPLLLPPKTSTPGFNDEYPICRQRLRIVAEKTLETLFCSLPDDLETFRYEMLNFDEVMERAREKKQEAQSQWQMQRSQTQVRQTCR